MFREQREDTVFLALATLLVAGTVLLFSLIRSDGDSTSSAAATPTTPPAELTAPRIPPVAAASAGDGRIATIYECRSAGQSIYSDRRCGPDAAARPVGRPNRMDPQDTSILSVPLRNAQPTLQRAPDDSSAAADTASGCRTLEEAKDSINARMRAGYSGPEGEWLRERLRSIDAQYHSLRCRHFH